MGQSSSRLQEQNTQPAPAVNSSIPSSVSGVSTDLQPNSTLDAGNDDSNGSQSRRSSFRKSLLKFVKPSNTHSRVNDETGNSGDGRRSWRNSRRWSKAHHNPVIREESHLPGQESHLPGPPSESSAVESSTLPPCSVEKGKQRETVPTLEEHDDHIAATTLDEAQLSYPLSVLDSEFPSTSIESSTVADASVSVPQHSDNNTHEDTDMECESDTSSQHSSPAPAEDNNEPISLPPPQASTRPNEQLPGSLQRQFPPPGTLVVVQGIVHTTDVSRSNNTASPIAINTGDSSTSHSGTTIDTPSDQTAPRSRNPLSALLRPRSSSRPVSTIISDPASAVTGASQTEPMTMAASDSQVSSDESIHIAVTPNPIESTPLASHDSPPVVENRTPLISSSSIDVLGTLLSVAAAATAASLLTGSSEPILSSGLAPPHPNIPSSRVPPSSIPSTSMPNLPSYGPPHDNAGFPDVSAAGRSERMRQAWGTIRERLGLRSSPSPPDDDTNGNHHNQATRTSDSSSGSSAVDGVELGSPVDTRELMLAEMARAFNIGLGLNGLGGLAPGSNATSGHADRDVLGNANNPEGPRIFAEDTERSYQSQPQSTTESNATLPPEGSFERFLVDLQVDLRVALTRPEDEPVPEGPQQPPPQETSMESQDARSPTGMDVLSSPPSLIPTSAGEGPRQPNGTVEPPTDRVPSNPAESHFYEDGDYVDMPSLQDVTDSESEFEEDGHEEEDYDDDDFQSVEQRSTHEEGHQAPVDTQHTPTTSGTGRIDAAGRINWWRLYRFPPIVSPHPDSSRQTTTLPTTTSSNTIPTLTDSLASPLPSTTLSNNGVPAEPAGPIEPIEPATSPPGTSPIRQPPSQGIPHPSPNSVVPVIVVGLQSVNSEWRPDLPQQPGDEGVDFFGQSGSERGPGDENDGNDDLDGWGGQHHASGGNGWDGTRGRGRARGWHSRAADAIRNLRPGRRNAEAGISAQLPAVTPGSRTFLIYVIGGYYPPDHNIVTGGPNILDSFEALLELADLLGQVKPPTVSKDEIDKSGLEIIKSSDLPQHEKDGKVSSNCTDRCLICLDDYEPDDPIRVMSCRHAFHKGCVDEWLQKGRNNCPACRSTGVTTDGHHTTSPASVS